jgi:hypothetical protein
VLVSTGIFLEAERNDELNKMVACNFFCDMASFVGWKLRLAEVPGL